MVGAWQPLPASLNGLDIALMFDTEVREQDRSEAILDNPYLSVCNASRLAVRYNQPFSAGDILLAGAATPAVFIEPDQKITAKVSKLGSCTIISK